MAKFNIKKDISLFDFADNQYKITKPIRLIELFAGIGSQAKALKNLNVDFEHHFVCEIEPQVVKTYNVIHGTNFEPTDITKISANDLNITNTDLYTYILTYSFPCQDLSLAGKGKGMEKGTGTRSSLLWEVERLLNECNELPQILLMENVPMVHSSENIKDFEKWLLFLESLGYKNYWKDLNAKNYGIPQNRDRCYMISLLNSNCDYTFPQPIKLKLRLKDMLEEKVDEKYFLSDKMIKYLTNPLAMNGGRKKVFMRNFDTNKEIASTITCAAGNRPPDNYILVKEATQKGYVEAYEGDGIYIDRPHQKRGIVQKDMIQTIKCNCNDVGVVVLGNYSPSGHNASRIVDNNGIAPTVMENHGTVTATVDKNLWSQSQMKMITNDGNVKRYINSDIVDEFKEGQAADISFPNGYNKAKRVHNECPAINGTTTESSFIVKNDLRIRKLTPLEVWRLMGFSDDDFDKAEKINSNTQLYKQAGNSIVVNVLMAIFKQFFN
ncbi:MAG: DNA (cytosine-5-)-methyltransferase [Methanobrevibacter smithii]|nr:DNA (cytosine-5-)-methyltransferase [Methanobrevibacter smithii]MDD7245169.1 DNA (cytosine-5-)-methyltransferase [Methanobrevibacter smithii]